MEIGEYIPNNLGIDGEGRLVNAAADYAHTPLIIYFYPKDNTPGCTAEACSLRDGYARLRQMGYEIIGISRDTPESHKRFAAKHSLPFTLLTDVTGEVCNDFGVWQLKKMAGANIWASSAPHSLPTPTTSSPTSSRRSTPRTPLRRFSPCSMPKLTHTNIQSAPA